ncbi:hypothetical protein ETAA8_70070 [Anatilimnocola aggregata]|uniref:DUF1501 domain-containing protein n=1 Tax=Anatilimnocola aggregata TaxID=2528021 RepID=A0A517YNR1_9BACT|nr:DUF1501 domain-containing protein [Anatilimnocola aggregata]QDU31846.1 hypothetical protein ETAA8_70070 [Anatilimnocola aggregata]
MTGCLDYRLSRRAMLAASGASILGMSVPNLLAAAGKDHAAKAEHVILFWNGGGMSHIDTWDPKPGRPTAGELAPINTSASGVQISEIFPQLAKQMHHCSLIRSIAGTQGDHGRASHHVQTSYLPFPNLIYPGLGSVVSHEMPNLGDLPAFISISGQAHRAGYLGQKCEAYFVPQPGDKDPYLAFPAGIAEVRGNKRLETLERFNTRFTGTTKDERLSSTKTSIDEAVKLMRSPALEAFEFSKVPTEEVERYGNSAFGRGCLLAKRLVDKGVRFVQINRGGYDVHSNAFPAMRNHGEAMDSGMASLVKDLADSGMLSKTLILMVSEFGRTPVINKDAGRDHWASVFSCFMAGGGIKGGNVIGSSDEDGAHPKDNPVKVQDIHASVCHALGIDPNKEVMTPLRRPMKLVDNGTPINGLFA